MRAMWGPCGGHKFKDDIRRMNRIVLQSQKELLREDILIYSLVMAFDLAYDYFANILMSFNILNLPHEPAGHAYGFGVFQILVLVFCLAQVIRKFKQVRYLS